MISVIIPAYNAGKYIKQCLNSIIHQTYRDLQIIVVDDGSSDCTKDICEKYQDFDNRIEVHSKNRGGVSSARNVGIEKARGEYITFVDADDYLALDILERAVSSYERNMLNIWGAVSVFDSGCIRELKEIDAYDMGRDELVANAIYMIDGEKYLGDFYRASWGKLYETSIIKEGKLIFDERLAIGEDAVFLISYLKYVTGVNLIEKKGYFYRASQFSATHSFHEDMYRQCALQYNLIKEAVYEMKLETNIDICDSLINFRWWMFTMLLTNARRGIRQKKLSLFKIYSDAITWMNCYRLDMRISTDFPEKLSPSYKTLYEYRQHSPFFLCSLYYLLWMRKKVHL